ARGIIFMAEGNTLFETLMLNLLEYPAQRPIPTSKNDCPAWEMDDPYGDEREIPHGYLDYLTWQNRKILLTPAQTTGGTAVREMALTPGLKLDPSVLDQDPMKHYRINDKSGHVSLRFQEHRALWRDSAALLRLSAEEQQVPAIFAWLGRLAGGVRPVLDEGLSVRYMALGMASDQAKIEFFRHEHLPLPVAYLDNPQLVDLLGHALSAAEAVASELWKAGTTMANVLLEPEESSERRANPDDVRDLRDTMALERRYWAQLEPLFRQTMQALPTTDTAAVVDWFAWLRRSAWDVFEEVSIGLGDQPRALKAAVRGREQLARGLGKVLNVEE
ncbi:MAG: type I-E CRISPR-associated protein Cse1/CasA, partial [Caldilineaceae bacterium]|nr:type I-E CRISPR-associated protein Cse1/CasA [Caldilineaceae bacterium]